MKKLDESQDCPCQKYDVRLTFKQARIAEKIGRGNLSQGIRDALEKAAKDIESFSPIGKKK